MASTLNGMFVEAAANHPTSTAFVHRVGDAWARMSWTAAHERVEAIGAGLVARGVTPRDRVAILANSRVEWTLADYAILGAGAVTVPIYQTNSSAECEHVLADSGSVAVVVEDAEQLAKVLEVRERLGALRCVIVMAPVGPMPQPEGIEVVSLDTIEEAGRAAGAEAWRLAGDAVQPQDLATLIYTSGTTGPPKGCMLSHHNYMYMTEQASSTDVGLFELDDRIVLFLPLAHTFARVVQFAATRLGCELAYTGIATLMDDLGELRPTLLPSVPRVFEKAHARIAGQFAAASPAKQRLIGRAMRVGALRGRYVQHGRRVPPVLAAQHALFHRLIFRKIHDRFGGNLRLLVSGGAPLSKEIAEFFLACGLVIVEGYGLTESTTAISVNSPRDFRLGSVGRVFTGTEARIAEDDELLVRGDVVFQGYWKRDDATGEVLDPDGWLHTGDVATIDREGFLYITDRKKDLIVTAGGKNVAPQNIENALKATRCISQALVYGDRRPFLTALVTLDLEEVAAVAEEHGLGNDPFHLVASPQVHSLVREALEEVNGKVGRVEQVKRIRILPLEFSQESGELTPTLKLKRRLVCRRYAPWLDEMYGDGADRVAGVTDPRVTQAQADAAGVA